MRAAGSHGFRPLVDRKNEKCKICCCECKVRIRMPLVKTMPFNPYTPYFQLGRQSRSQDAGRGAMLWNFSRNSVGRRAIGCGDHRPGRLGSLAPIALSSRSKPTSKSVRGILVTLSPDISRGFPRMRISFREKALASRSWTIWFAKSGCSYNPTGVFAISHLWIKSSNNQKYRYSCPTSSTRRAERI